MELPIWQFEQNRGDRWKPSDLMRANVRIVHTQANAFTPNRSSINHFRASDSDND